MMVTSRYKSSISVTSTSHSNQGHDPKRIIGYDVHKQISRLLGPWIRAHFHPYYSLDSVRTLTNPLLEIHGSSCNLTRTCVKLLSDQRSNTTSYFTENAGYLTRIFFNHREIYWHLKVDLYCNTGNNIDIDTGMDFEFLWNQLTSTTPAIVIIVAAAAAISATASLVTWLK